MKKIILQDAGSLMAKLINPRQYKTGHFINRNKTRKGYIYSIVPDILNLAPEEIYVLTRKIGEDRFTLEMAVEKIPELAQYLKKTGKVAASLKKVPAKKSRVMKQKRKAKAVKGKPGRKALPKLPEPQSQNVGVEDVVAGFLHEMDKMGGLRVNFYLTVRVLKG